MKRTKKRLSKAKSAQLHALNKSPRAGYLHCPNNIKAAACTAQATNRDLQAEVQRLRDVEQSLMGTVDGLLGDLDDLLAAHQRLQGEHTALQQVASRAAATNHSLRAARRTLQGQVHIYRHKRRPHHSPFTFKQRQQLLVLEQHPVSMEVPALLQLMSLRTCKEAIKTVDVNDLQQRMGQLRAELRRKEDATAAAQRSAKAERQITDAAHKVGRVVVNVGDHACQERLAAAHALAFGGRDFGHTTADEAMQMTAKQLQSYLQFHKQEVHTSWRVPKLQSHVCNHIRGKLAAAAPPQQQLTPAGTTPELAVPAGAPPQQQQQLAAASTSRKRAAPAANKSRAAKQGPTPTPSDNDESTSTTTMIFPEMSTLVCSSSYPPCLFPLVLLALDSVALVPVADEAIAKAYQHSLVHPKTVTIQRTMLKGTATFFLDAAATKKYPHATDVPASFLLLMAEFVTHPFSTIPEKTQRVYDWVTMWEMDLCTLFCAYAARKHDAKLLD
ncbi:hypothetical protein QJQ45_008631 [Haematococcus lacustris]|nr:hypothetical protein QJQ45_008631 [Haematococcus lacustris]